MLLVRGRVKDRSHARHQFGGRVARVSDRQDFVGTRRTALNQAGNAMGEHGGFARTCTGHDQHGAMHMLDSFLLLCVEVD